MEWLEGLNPAQREAVEHVHGPMLVLAGAGSGKTRVLTARIANLIEQHGVPVQRIFAVTFTNKAAGEMKARVGRMLGRDPAGLWIGTFHASPPGCSGARRSCSASPARSPSTTRTTARRSCAGCWSRRAIRPRRFTPRAVSVGHLRREEPDAVRRRTSPRRARSTALAKVAADVYAALGPALQAANAMDFDDLMLHPLRALPRASRPAGGVARRFAFILVDEFQDTNRAQYELVRALGGARQRHAWWATTTSPSTAGAAPTCGTCAQFQEDFPGTQVVRLEENYRSTQVVLDAANAVIAENRGRMGKTLRDAPAGRGTGHPARRRRRARRGRVGRARARAPAPRPTTSSPATWRCSIAPTRSRAPWRRRSAAPACPTASSAPSASTTGAR